MRAAYISERKSGGIQVLLLLALCAGIIIGSVYLSRSWNESGAEIKEYISAVFGGAEEGTVKSAVFRASLMQNLITLGIIFILGFFRFGFIGTGFIIIRKGFITGYTATSFLRAYGMGGILAMLASSPSAVVSAAVMLIFSAFSVSFSLREDKFQKKFIFSYIFFTIFMITIFCALSFSEGFLTTIFMKWISPKIN